MKTAGILEDDRVDFGKTTARKLATEKIGADLWRQVLLVTFFWKDGTSGKVVTAGDISHEECSMFDVEVLLVDRKP